MMVNKKLEKYIRVNLKKGFDKEKMKEHILKSGYSQEAIDEAFDKAEIPKGLFGRRKIKIRLESPPTTEEVLKDDINRLPKQKIIINKEELRDDENPIIMDSPKDNKAGLKSKLDEVNEKLDLLTKRDKKKEYKEFKLPSKIKRQLKKLALKNKILIILLTRNRGMIPMVTEIKDGFVNIDGTPHQCAVDQVFLWKGKYPAMVIPEWDISPIGTKDYYDAVANKRIADPIAIAIRMLENKENIMKNKLSSKAWIFIGLAIIAGLYVLFGGMGG